MATRVRPKVSYEVYKSHLILLLQTAWPNIITFLIQLAIPVSSTLMVGHIGSPVLIGAAALGNMFANATGFAVGSGLSMALDTLCSQAFGAKKYYLVGLHCQRAMVILSIACVPIGLIWYYANFVLQYIGTAETAYLSQYWLRILIPSIWPRIMYEAYRRYLLGQRVLWPITLTVAIVSPTHIITTYLFVYYFNWGFEGAAWAISLSYWLLFGSLVLVSNLRVWYLRRKQKLGFQQLELSKFESLNGADINSIEEGLDEQEDNGDLLHTWPKLSSDIFRGWGAFLKLGAATAASLVTEWGSFEVNAVIASTLGEVPLASHAILSNFAAIWYCTPSGIAAATTALVGNMLGAGEPDRAWIFTRLAYGLEILYGVINGAIGMLYRQYLGKAFTNDKQVIDLVSSMALLLWVYGIFDALKAVGMGVLRGSGRPSITVFGNVLSCLIVGYPIAISLVLLGGYGLPGLWSGMTAAWLVAGSIYVTIIFRTDWDLEVKRAAERNKSALLSTKKGRLRSLDNLLEEEFRDEKSAENGDGSDQKNNISTNTASEAVSSPLLSSA